MPTADVEAEPEAPSGASRRAWSSVGVPAATWSVIALGILTLQACSNAWASGSSPRWTHPGSLFAGWVQYDGPEYLSIAAHGYTQRQLVWFPLYPMLVRLVHAFGGGWVVSAVLVSAIGGVLAAVAFWRWLAGQGLSKAARRTALGVMLVYPYAWFLYGVVYADAVFTALVLASFLLAERRRYAAAGAAAALATATRPSGFAVVLGLFVLALDRGGVLTVRTDATGWAARLGLPTRFHRDHLKPEVFAPLLGFIGLFAYAAWQWISWGSPLRFVTEEANYHDTGNATYFKRQYFEAFYRGSAQLGGGKWVHLETTSLQALILVVVLLSVPAVGRRFGWGYGAYVFFLAAFPGYTVSTFQGVGRYLIPAFPCFALVGEWLSDPAARRKVLRIGWLLVSAGLMTVMAWGYARTWYLT